MIYTSISAIMCADTEIYNDDSSIELNYWLGSTVRGALIKSLKDEYCINNQLDCDNCNIGIICPIKGLFNTKTSDSNKANPIILNNRIINNKEFILDITLLANGIMYRELIKDILKEGLLINSHGRSIVFRASNIKCTDIHNVDAYRLSDKNYNKVIINFKSPVSLQSSAIKLEFKDLIRIAMTRFRSIQNISSEEYTFSYQELIDKAKEIKTMNKKIEYVNLFRYSTKHNTRNKAPCIIGEITYEGDLRPFVDILKYAELFNIGKWTTMGLGKVEVELYE